MSLDNPVVLYPPDKLDPRAGVVFFDDFVGALYDDTVWTVAGKGTVSNPDVIGGYVDILADKNKTFEFYCGDMGQFSVAKNFDVEWRAKLLIGLSGSSAECGLEGAGDQATNKVCWRRVQGTANYQCIAVSGGASTPVDSGVVADNNVHLFRVIGSAGFLQFFLDGVIKAVITTNVTASALQPYAYCASSNGQADGEVTADYVQVSGDQ